MLYQGIVMKSVIIFYEHKARELESIVLLKEELEKKGIKVVLYSYLFEYYESIRYMKNHPADLIVIPWLYVYRSYELLMPFVRINPRCVFINLHHEQISSEAIYSSLMPRHELARNNVYHFSWSEDFKNHLIQYGVREDMIFVDGIGRLDTLFLNKDKMNYKDKFAEEFGLNKEKKWVLYCETRDWVWDNKNYDDFLNRTYGEELAKEYRDDQQNSIDMTFNDFNNLKDDFFEEFELIYRPHPGIGYTPDINKNIRIISKYSIYDWFTCISANVVSYSTAAYESEAFGIPTFVDTICKMNPKFALGGFDRYTHLDSMNELSEKLQNYKHGSKIYEEYIGVVDGHSTERMANTIEKLLNDENAVRPILVESNNFKHFLRSVRESLMRFMYHTNLIKVIKYPKMAYDLYNDIPYGDKEKYHD